MSADIQRLNQRLASAQPSATYRLMDRVAERRAQGAKIISSLLRAAFRRKT
jgi:aspartate aminotransferase